MRGSSDSHILSIPTHNLNILLDYLNVEDIPHSVNLESNTPFAKCQVILTCTEIDMTALQLRFNNLINH